MEFKFVSFKVVKFRETVSCPLLRDQIFVFISLCEETNERFYAQKCLYIVI